MISLWGFGAAGSKAIGEDKRCSVKDLENKGVRLTMASKPNEVLEILNGDPTNPARAACIRRSPRPPLPCLDLPARRLLARFPGTARRRWYLSDGGHFENMGGYELLRRRLPFILIADGEMDADFTYEGLANLVRKARLDFGAEVHFLTEEQLDEVVKKDVRPYIGTLAQLQRGEWKDTEDETKPHGRLEKPGRDGFSLAHAALARVTYASDPNAYSWLLYVKPTLTGREPVDVLEYHAAHPSFPHEPTIDQFFDEAQWESYRRLGEYIADVLFGRIDLRVPDPHKTTMGWEPDLDRQAPQDTKDMEAMQAPRRARRLPRYS